MFNTLPQTLLRLKVEFVAEVAKGCFTQWLSKYIRNLKSRGNMASNKKSH